MVAQVAVLAVNTMSGSLAREAEALLDALDERVWVPALERRATKRFCYRQHLKLEFLCDGQSCISHWIFPRDLGNGGLGCLHLESVHPDARALVYLVAQHGAISARVVRLAHCTPVEDGWHLLGLAFEERIDALPFL